MLVDLDSRNCVVTPLGAVVVVVVVIGASSNIIVFRPTPHNIRSIRNNLSFAATITTTE